MGVENNFLIFRQKSLNSLYCAVPADDNFPCFLTPENWEFGGTVNTQTDIHGFDAKQADIFSRLNGFYLFHSVN